MTEIKTLLIGPDGSVLDINPSGCDHPSGKVVPFSEATRRQREIASFVAEHTDPRGADFGCRTHAKP